MTTTPANKPPSASALPAGYRLDEYAIEAVLGHGGFGITYRAHDVKLDSRVAIKEYFPQAFCARTDRSTIVPRSGADTAMVENYQWGLNEFLKEARALAKFKHPHIVRVLRFLEANGTAYLVMEYEEGESLAHHLRKRGGFLDEHGLLGIFLPVLTGLQAVHEAGLLHLDIKPDNIYLRTDGKPMLIDFGSSRQIRGNTPQTGAVALTPGYCALEQYPGLGEVGPWTDVYGMGATIYRCITGKQPVDSLERHRTFAKSRIDPLRPAASFEQPLYAGHIRTAIDQALKLASAERPASAFILQQGLMGKDMTRVEKRGPEVMFRPGSGYIGTILAAPTEEKRRRRRLSLFEKTVALLVILATFAVVIPKLLIDTGQITDGELYSWIDENRQEAVARVQELGDTINERVFGKPPAPKASSARPAPRRTAAEPVAAPVAEAPPAPAGSGKKKVLDVAMPGQPLRALGLLKHGTVLVTATDDGLVRLWDAHSGEPRITISALVRAPAALAVFPSSQWFAAPDAGHAIGIFDPLGNRESVLRNDPPHPVTILTVSPDDRLLAEAGEDGGVSLWDLAANRRLHRFAPDKSAVLSLAFTPDGQWLMAGNARGELIAWEIASGKSASRRRLHESGIIALAVAPGGLAIASRAVNGELQLTPMSSETGGTVLDRSPAGGNDLVFSADGRWLLAGGAKGVRVWDTGSGELAHELPNDGYAVRALALSRDGKLIAVGGDDQTVRLWR
jgi:serine/threonine protein kinase/WD40 repeat protein